MSIIKTLRIKAGLKQKDLASFLKISQPNYSNYENGKIPLNLEYAKKLSKFYNVPLHFIISQNKNIIFLAKEEYLILKEASDIIEKLNNAI